MRLAIGLAALGVSVVVLGWWARQEYAPHMQTLVQQRATEIAAGSVHAVAAQVAGRDIIVRGRADGMVEHDRLIAAFDGIRGRRLVVDALEVLRLADPFALDATWRDGVLVAEGDVPTEAAQMALAAQGAEGLILAAGAPDAQWARAAGAGIAALRQLTGGHLVVSGRALTLDGIARTPVEGDALRATLQGALPEGYAASVDLEYLDDGTPPAYSLHFGATGGTWLEGKLPVGVSGMDVAAALGLNTIDDGANVALTGEPGAVAPVFAALAMWLPEMETLDVRVAADSTEVTAGFGAGADLDLLRAGLDADLAGVSPALTLNLREVFAEQDEGARRSNALTGAAEVLAGGYWLPAVDFAPAADTCAAQTDAVLSASRIGFVTGSARLDAHARGAVNALAGVMGVCVREAGLRAEIGGHTDTTGSDEANLALSRERAGAVRAALIARGVPAEAVSAEGYGASQPIADNATDEGRAANRRTAVRWIE